eukprot:CCRYP_009015-RC/>CCRYP_009015-RC protein AED:0.28 eAED:0.28 QI:0/1/0.5/1/0/0.5/2/208/717
MALRGDEEIDSLLSIMGGCDSLTAEVSHAATSTHNKDAEKKKKRAKKRKHLDGEEGEKDRSNQNQDSFAASRLGQNCFRWPQSNKGHRHLALGPGLAHDCKGYIMSHSNEDAATRSWYGSLPCDNCGASSSAHELYITLDPQQCEEAEAKAIMSLASIIVAARNARCLMGEYYVISAESTSKDQGLLVPAVNSIQCSSEIISRQLDLFTGRVLSQLKKITETVHPKNSSVAKKSFSCIPSDDLILLKEKAASMVKSIAEYKSAIITPSPAINMTSHKIDAMAMCDVVYYRSYYSTITLFGDTIKCKKGVFVKALIPHPPTFFSCPGLAWDALESGRKAFSIFLGSSKVCDNHDGTSNERHFKTYAAPLDATTRNLLLDSWSLKSHLDGNCVAVGDINPLLQLWQSRFLESLRHVWATGYSLAVSPLALQASPPLPKNDTNNQYENLLQCNETISISSAVSIWRDSIRDYPAHFYAYACPTERSLDVISNHLKLLAENDCAVEAGAGTGYWSALINSFSPKTLPTDRNQTEHIPLVLPYDIAPPSGTSPNEYHGLIPTFTEVKIEDSLEKPRMGTSQQADSTQASTLMLCYPPPASDMALASLSNHIQNEDATYLTIWKRKNPQQNRVPDIHSPAFGFCSSQPCGNFARKRCRFARCLQYCSPSCFQKHASSRRAYLAIHMVHLPFDVDINFNSYDHFINLQTITVTKKRKDKRKKGS